MRCELDRWTTLISLKLFIHHLSVMVLLIQMSGQFLVASAMFLHLLLKVYTYLHLLLTIAIMVHAEITGVDVEQLLAV